MFVLAPSRSPLPAVVAFCKAFRLESEQETESSHEATTLTHDNLALSRSAAVHYMHV